MTYIVTEDEHNETISLKTKLGNIIFYIGSLDTNLNYIGYINDNIPCPKCGIILDGFYSQNYYSNNITIKLNCFECEYKLTEEVIHDN